MCNNNRVECWADNNNDDELTRSGLASVESGVRVWSRVYHVCMLVVVSSFAKGCEKFLSERGEGVSRWNGGTVEQPMAVKGNIEVSRTGIGIDGYISV